MSDRIACCVPFCRRTRKNDKGYTDWICAVHWRRVPPLVKSRKNKLFGRYRRRFGNTWPSAYPQGSTERYEAARLSWLCDLAWDRAKRAAIERAAGIS